MPPFRTCIKNKESQYISNAIRDVLLMVHLTRFYVLEVQIFHCDLLVRVKAESQQEPSKQCMIIGLLLWSGFCLGLSGLWPLTSSHSQTTIPLRWRPNSPSISLLLIRLRPLLRSAADECFKTDCRGERERGESGEVEGRMSAGGGG